MNSRYPTSRTPSSRPFGETALYSIVRVRAQGGGYKQITNGAEAAVTITATGGGYIISGVGGSIAVVLIEAQGGGIKFSEDLYFIDEPRITTQGVLATHVTVESPTHNYTASISMTPAEEMIERKTEISEGDEVVCQQVAERLLEQWGREQKSVSGHIPFTVKLRFKEMVRVRIPVADIDEEMVLQRKEHNLSNFTSTVSLGDTILGDYELLARILDEIKK